MDMKDMWMQLAGYFIIPVFSFFTLLWLLRHRLQALIRSLGLQGRTETDLDVDASSSDTEIRRFCAAQDPSVFSETFTAFFKQLKEDQQLVFGLMLSEARVGRLVTAAHLSEVMGLQRRPAHLQKVMRNKAIMGINEAFMRTFRTKVLLIERQKAEMDRRSNIYRLPDQIVVLLRDWK
jgi:hypothetical protein